MDERGAQIVEPNRFHGLSPGDLVTFVVVPLTLGVVVLLATYLPARRAVRLDPVAALRSE